MESIKVDEVNEVREILEEQREENEDLQEQLSEMEQLKVLNDEMATEISKLTADAEIARSQHERLAIESKRL